MLNIPAARYWLIVPLIFVVGISGAVAKHRLPVLPPIGGLPPQRVNAWIKIFWLGAMNHPIVPVYYFAAKRVAPMGSLTRYGPISKAEFKRLSEFTLAYKCAVDQISGRPPYPPSIGIEEHSDGRDRLLCVLPLDSGCGYLFGVANLPSIDWRHKDTWPIFQFAAELGCKGPLTKWH